MDQDFESVSFWQRAKNNLVELIEFLAVVGVIVLMVHAFVAEPHQVSGSSMVPNFLDGEFIITNKLATRFYGIKRGEIVIFKSPRDLGKVFIKRVIAIPGDSIKILGGKIYLNKTTLSERYLPPNTFTAPQAFLAEGEEIIIPDDQYFFIGDNRGGSSDSREWGPVKRELIIGQAWLRYWPPPKFGLIEHAKL